MFVDVFNSLIKNKAEILQGYETIVETLIDTPKLGKEREKLQRELEIVAEMLRKCVEENAHNTLDQAEYQEHYSGLAEQYESIKKGLEVINEKRLERSAKHESNVAFIKELEQREGLITEFDEELWSGTVEKMIVNTKDKITFVFKDGMELEWNM